MPIIDLNQLPAPDVVEELDFETILAERKATLISLYPEDQQEAVARTLTLESEPLVKRHCCKVSDEAAFCLIQRPYISKTLLTRRISPRGSP